MTPQQPDGTPTPAQVEAVTRAKEYSKMNKAEMNSAYDDSASSQTPQRLLSKVRKCTVPFLTSNYHG